MLLVGGLVVMAMFFGYENFFQKLIFAKVVSALVDWGQLDTGTLKPKVSASIVAISAIFVEKACDSGRDFGEASR